jgi:hypothetical protein
MSNHPTGNLRMQLEMSDDDETNEAMKTTLGLSGNGK